jgi:hypothetical protein
VLSGGSASATWAQRLASKRRQYLMTQDLRNIRKGEGFIWIAGQNNPIPAIFPPYYDDLVLKHRARRNPYIKP